MTRKKRWRYYCDHCNKSGASGGHMKTHEARCCRNPERVCGFHSDERIEEPQPALADLTAALEGGKSWAEGLKALREAAHGCPACMLAGILQSEVLQEAKEMAHGDPESFPWPELDFDFKKEVESFWVDVHAFDGERQAAEHGHY